MADSSSSHGSENDLGMSASFRSAQVSQDLPALWGSSLPNSSQGLEYVPPPSSPPGSSAAEAEGLDFKAGVAQEVNSCRVEDLRHRCQTVPGLAVSIISRYEVERHEWCELLELKPTKRGGYLQLSAEGANKFAVLQEVVLWAGGSVLDIGQECSHLCHRPRCRVISHIFAESGLVNQSRKNCSVWVDCHHCPKKILTCAHAPLCVKFCPGYSDMDDLMLNGACRVIEIPAP